jgi:hypothetical protein
MAEIEVKTRYDAMGPPNDCEGQCEGTRWVPVYEEDTNDEEGPWHDLWLEAEKKKPTEDGVHFVPCPLCNAEPVAEKS